ncbi:LysR family transcription regulatory protein [Striga asiatica]|uniref:LysR family transcription regulatory protein n=1 Tax=Striga asiatica TaxID=4170 RepID=A0A5A7QEP7_STRAF|nr:LysR family transcription regulatory protein [Striga asiatica]
MGQTGASKGLDIILSGEEVGLATNAVGEGTGAVLMELATQELVNSDTMEKEASIQPKTTGRGKVGASWKRKQPNSGRLLRMSEQPSHSHMAIEMSKGEVPIKSQKRSRESVLYEEGS